VQSGEQFQIIWLSRCGRWFRILISWTDDLLYDVQYEPRGRLQLLPLSIMIDRGDVADLKCDECGAIGQTLLVAEVGPTVTGTAMRGGTASAT
jgi:hypothetical protein